MAPLLDTGLFFDHSDFYVIVDPILQSLLYLGCFFYPSMDGSFISQDALSLRGHPMFLHKFNAFVLAFSAVILLAAQADAKPLSVQTQSPVLDVQPQKKHHHVHHHKSSHDKKSIVTPQTSPLDDINDIPVVFAPEKSNCGGFDCIPLVEPVDDVYYTVKERNTVAKQASLWGVPSNVLTILNNGLTLTSILEPGQKLLVDARLPSAPVARSQGKCNRGRLYNARLLPEGEGYFLRTLRPRSWGTDLTIQAVMTLFKAYHENFPDAPDINVGDISKRRGGKAKPHASHQSGRDIDIGFAHTSSPDEHHPEHFIRANEDNLDLERTWFIAKTLVQTGTVQVIFIDKSVQKMLYYHVKDRLTQEQLEFFFSYPKHDHSSTAVFRHWPGHKNHFHVRFICPPGQTRCHK